MGGTLILVTTLVSTLLWAELSNRLVWTVLAVTFAFGLIGFYDDYLKLVVRNPRGLAPRWKYFWQSVAGLATAATLYYTATEPAETTLFLPFVKNFARAALSAFGFIAHRLSHDRRHEQRGESHRRARRTRHHAGGARDRGARHLRLRERQCGVRPLPADPRDPRRRRAADLLRLARRRGTRVPVVQLLSGAGLHGRRRRARDRRGHRRARGDRAPGAGGAA